MIPSHIFNGAFEISAACNVLRCCEWCKKKKTSVWFYEYLHCRAK